MMTMVMPAMTASATPTAIIMRSASDDGTTEKVVKSWDRMCTGICQHRTWLYYKANIPVKYDLW